MLDTSVVIADRLEEDSLSASAAISVMTIAELHAGVRLARDSRTRALRAARLRAIQQAFVPIPIDVAVAEHYGRVLAIAHRGGRAARATDVLIIATAAATGRRLHTLEVSQRRLAQAADVAISG